MLVWQTWLLNLLGSNVILHRVGFEIFAALDVNTTVH
jgi:hypothetical protein